jgi:multidrug resistance efflux pump
VASHLDATSAASMTFKLEVFRERASARKAVVSQEAEAAEAITQLGQLNEFSQQLRERLDEVEKNFAEGSVLAPMAGIVSTNLAHVGQSLVAGTPVAEIFDPTDVFVDWYIPSVRLIEPKPGKEVFVLFGNRRIPGKIAEILRVSDVYAGKQPLLTGDRAATQIARIRFSPEAVPPALNSTVYIHMYYSDLALRAVGAVVDFLGLH